MLNVKALLPQVREIFKGVPDADLIKGIKDLEKEQPGITDAEALRAAQGYMQLLTAKQKEEAAQKQQPQQPMQSIAQQVAPQQLQQGVK